MKYYSITVAVDQDAKSDMNFINMLESLCQKKEPLYIRPKHTVNYETEVLYFSNTKDESYETLMALAKESSELRLNIASVNQVEVIHDSIDEANAVIKELKKSIDSISNVLFQGKEPEPINTVSDNNSEPSNPQMTIEIPEKPEVTNEDITPDQGNDAKTTTQDSDNSEEASTSSDNVDENLTQTNDVQKMSDTATSEITEENDEEGDYEPEDDPTGLDTEISMDDSPPENYKPKEAVDKTPNGKLYPDNYIPLMTKSELLSNSKEEQLDILRAQVGRHEVPDEPLERKKTWQGRPFHSYNSYVERYHEMNDVDSPLFWLKSYMHYALSEDIYSELKDQESFYTFDSFVRAKLNRDLKCEPMVKPRIDNLYK